MTVRDTARALHERRFAYVLGVDADKCSNVYGVAPCTAAGAAGTECYITFQTCQDKANFVRGTKTFSFCSRGMAAPAGELVRPYIASVNVAPTEINPAKGLATRSQVSVVLIDEPGSDLQADPYASTRASEASGSVLTRWLARNRNLPGRFARLRTGYVVEPFDWDTFQDELYVIDAVKGPDKSGNVTLVLSDLIHLADKTTVPAATDGKLNAAITASALSLTMQSGQGSQYADPATSGKNEYVRVGDEVIRYTSKSTDTLSWPDTSYRGQFGTTAAAQQNNAAVKLCRAWIDKTVKNVVEDILNAAGVADGYIDLAGIQTEIDTWLGTNYNFTAIVTDPVKASELLSQVLVATNAFGWWSPVAQKFKFKCDMPQLPSEADPALLTDDASFIDGSVEVELLEAERITLAAINYAMASGTANLKEDKNFLRGEVVIDTDAESANEYGSRIAEVVQSRWLGTGNENAAKALVSRMIGRRRDAPRKYKFALDPKDYDFNVGDLRRLYTKKVTTTAGAPDTVTARITKVVDKGKRIECEARSTVFARRYAFITPAGYPDFTSATDAQKRYAYICPASGEFADGTDGYRII